MIDLKNLSDNEIIEMQYNLLEDLKQKKLVNTNTVIDNQKQSVDEFIRQSFKDDNGNYESYEHYMCRLKWFELGCPKYNKFAKKTKFSHDAIKYMSSRYKWQNIRKQACDLGYSPNKVNKFVDTNKKIVKRNSKEYNKFHESVLKRDKVCQCCGSNHDLEVHHTLPFKQYNSLGADSNNGIVLCKECHTKYHSKYGYKRKTNPITLAQFLRDYGMNPQTLLHDLQTISDDNDNAKQFLNDFKDMLTFSDLMGE